MIMTHSFRYWDKAYGKPSYLYHVRQAKRYLFSGNVQCRPNRKLLILIFYHSWVGKTIKETLVLCEQEIEGVGFTQCVEVNNLGHGPHVHGALWTYGSESVIVVASKFTVLFNSSVYTGCISIPILPLYIWFLTSLCFDLPKMEAKQRRHGTYAAGKPIGVTIAST